MKENKQKELSKRTQNEKIAGAKSTENKMKILARGRIFEGYVVKKFKKRIVVEFERSVYVRKYERYSKKKTKLHAHLPDKFFDEINVGDYVRVGECRPISKIIHFIFIKKIR